MPDVAGACWPSGSPGCGDEPGVAARLALGLLIALTVLAAWLPAFLPDDDTFSRRTRSTCCPRPAWASW